jgi:hypothetical protein
MELVSSCISGKTENVILRNILRTSTRSLRTFLEDRWERSEENHHKSSAMAAFKIELVSLNVTHFYSITYSATEVTTLH